MAMADLKTPKGLQDLDVYLSDKSYIEGYKATQADVAVYEALGNKIPTTENPHVLRWYNHIKSYDLKSLPGEKKAPGILGHDDHHHDDDHDDIDLFGSDEEEDPEAAKIREERLKAYAEKKSKKPALIAKSSIIIDVKPWGDETDLEAMEQAVRSIEMNGLVWGVSKLVPVGYGIKKLQIVCVVEDDQVSVDELVEKIQEFEEHVQSVDIAAFNKI